LLQGRPHVLPDDVKALAVPVLAHRLLLASDNADRSVAATVIAEVTRTVPAPLSGA
jgi:MoxR-like ATPase